MADSMLEALLREDVPVLVQGITGRAGRSHALQMQAAGTRIVGGVAGPGAKSNDGPSGIPVFTDCAAAVAATGARASVALVPPLQALAAAQEAFAAGIQLLVSVTEGVPVHDAIKAAALARECGATWVGPSTPGLAVPGRMKMGFLPEVTLAPGSIGVMSKSGTLSYEANYRLVRNGLGQSLWLGVGGDPVKGTRFADLLPLFAAHAGTRAVLLIGEIGGTEEEDCAAAIKQLGFDKPVFAVIAGSSAREGVTMGHAGALIQGGLGTHASKTEALKEAGVHVHQQIDALVDAMVRTLS
ncbi:MAG TPA: succinate--CoA ligase subunit alpha [Burkholderiales bacterium]|jgi:succinyl-CoA synthetase alpha subunit|nr:succinate--CoA ligase subunit alpha [Burkholderiales bacterium]